MGNSSENKMKLSLVMRGRDNYKGRNNYESSMYINAGRYCIYRHIKNFRELGLSNDDVEIVFVDWGSNNSIRELFDIDGYGFIRYIIVPKEIAQKYNPENGFDFVRSINVGLVRAKGENLLHIDMDTFMETSSMKKLWYYLDDPVCKNRQHYFRRFEITQKWFSQLFGNPDIIPGNLSKKYNFPKNYNVKPKDFTGDSAAVMVSKEALHMVCGYDETLVYWGWQDWDLFNRLYYKGYKGHELYNSHKVTLLHLEHSRSNPIPNKTPNLEPPIIFNPTGPNWGLKNMDFEEIIV